MSELRSAAVVGAAKSIGSWRHIFAAAGEAGGKRGAKRRILAERCGASVLTLFAGILSGDVLTVATALVLLVPAALLARASTPAAAAASGAVGRNNAAAKQRAGPSGANTAAATAAAHRHRRDDCRWRGAITDHTPAVRGAARVEGARRGAVVERGRLHVPNAVVLKLLLVRGG